MLTMKQLTIDNLQASTQELNCIKFQTTCTNFWEENPLPLAQKPVLKESTTVLLMTQDIDTTMTLDIDKNIKLITRTMSPWQ